ncbi:MAG: CHAD domain-containing protein [Gammaproteobacteria bacterium]
MPKLLHFRAAGEARLTALESLFDRVVPDGQWQHRTIDRRALLDTVDRRLLSRGLFLLCDTAPTHCLLSLHDALGATLARDVPATHCPQRPTTLGDRRLRDPIESAVGVRSLLPVRLWSVESSRHSVRNADDKLLGDVVLERHTLLEAGFVIVTVSVWPRRGYRGELARYLDAARVMRSLERLARTSTALLDSILPPAPGIPTRLPQLALNPQQPAGPELARLMARYQRIIRDNERGIREDIDSEFLHDFRIALRHARTFAGAFRSLVPPPTPLLDDFRWLSSETSLLRDLDVWLQDLDLPDATVEPAVVAAVTRRRRLEQRRLSRVLQSARYVRFHRRWTDWVEQLSSCADGAPTGTVLTEAIRKRYKRLRRRLRAGDRTLSLAALHDVRKDAKKLRYLAEAYATMQSCSKCAGVLRDLKRLQNVAGPICDQRARADLIAAWCEHCEHDMLRKGLEAELERCREAAEIDLDRQDRRKLARHLEHLASASFAKSIERLDGESTA